MSRKKEKMPGKSKFKGYIVVIASILSALLTFGATVTLFRLNDKGGGDTAPPVVEQTTFGGKTLRVWTFDEAPSEPAVDYVVDNMFQHNDNTSDAEDACFEYTDTGALRFSPALFGNDVTSYLSFGEGLEMSFDAFSYFTIDFDVVVDNFEDNGYQWFEFGLYDGSPANYYNRRFITQAKIKLTEGQYHVTYLISNTGDVVVYIDGNVYRSFSGAFTTPESLCGLVVTAGYDADHHSSYDTNLQAYQLSLTMDNVIFNYFEPGYTGAISKLIKDSGMKTNPDTVLGGCMGN